jgi:hypothetical protein
MNTVMNLVVARFDVLTAVVLEDSSLLGCDTVSSVERLVSSILGFH